MPTKLSAVEIKLYFFLWFSATFYSLYKLYEVQTDVLSKVELSFSDLQPGWKIISRLKDISDFEWSSWKYMVSSSWHYFLLHFVVSEWLRIQYDNFVPHWYIISSIAFTTAIFGVKQLLTVIAQPLIFAFVLLSGGGKIFVWIVSIAIFISLNYLKYFHTFWDFYESENGQDEEIFLLLSALGWIELRCIGFCIDYIEKKGNCYKGHIMRDKIWNDLIEMFSYVLYFPTLYAGPICLYDCFKKGFNVNNGNTVEKLKSFLIEMVLYVFYTIMLDFAFHYIYFMAMQNDIQILRTFPSLALCGGGLWMGLQFHMKYVISYGMIGAFMTLDNIEPPPTPRCIARIHVYSQMWKYFDVGFYKFLIKYIYKPTIGLLAPLELTNRELKLVASLTTFSFIFIWHGSTFPVLVWTIFNFIGLTLEQTGSFIVETDIYKRFKKQILKTDRMEERFRALVCVPLFAMSAVSSFYLFGGYDLGNLYVEYAVHPSWCNAIIISVALYSCCHVSVALQDVPSRTDRKILKEITSR